MSDESPEPQAHEEPVEGPFVTLMKVHDVTTSHLLESVLKQEGIAVSVLGTRSAASMGFGQVVLDQRFEVPQSQLERARDIAQKFLKGIEAGHTVNRPPELTPSAPIPDAMEDGEAPAAEPKPKRHLTAAGLIVYPGFAHAYVGLPWTGFILITGLIAALFAPESPVTSTRFITVYSGAVIADLVGGQIGAMLYNRGTRLSTLVQLLIGAAYIAVFVVVAHAIHGRWPT